MISSADMGLLISPSSSSSVSSLSMISSGSVGEARPILAGQPNKPLYGLHLMPA